MSVYKKLSVNLFDAAPRSFYGTNIFRETFEKAFRLLRLGQETKSPPLKPKVTFSSTHNSSDTHFFSVTLCDARNAANFSLGSEDTEDDTSGPSISETGDNNHSDCASLPALLWLMHG